ncbi:hypothetical protein CKO24_03155 [Rhodothalassium salexigens DSM 2132]|nr:hypothetical protein [Rhodothalassium salexigens DSM 2132]
MLVGLASALGAAVAQETGTQAAGAQAPKTQADAQANPEATPQADTGAPLAVTVAPAPYALAEAGYAALRAGRLDEAVRRFAAALARTDALRASQGPGGLDAEALARLAADLGFALDRLGRRGEAAVWFARAQDGRPSALMARAEGYALKAAGGAEARAAAAFRRAIRLERARADAEPRRLERLRREVRDLDRVVGLSASVLLRGEPGAGVTLAGPTLVNSQGAVRADVWLKRWVGVDLRPFARALWAVEDGGVAGETVQAGVGVRWRPLAATNLVVGVERLVAVGDAARDDWLLGIDWSAGRGYERPPLASRWGYWSVLGQAALIDPAAADWLVSGDARAGHAWGLGQRWALRAGVALNTLAQHGFGDTLSLVEAGPGLALVWRAPGTAERAGSGRVRLELRWRQKFAGRTANRSGLTLTLSAGF